MPVKIFKVKKKDSIEEEINEWMSNGRFTPKNCSFHVTSDFILVSYEFSVGDNQERCPDCRRCGAPTVKRVRKSDGQPFWGCSLFPGCRGVIDYEDGLEILRRNGDDGDVSNPTGESRQAGMDFMDPDDEIPF